MNALISPENITLHTMWYIYNKLAKIINFIFILKEK